jgi:E3 ubiquitin-protein ligase HERC4
VIQVEFVGEEGMDAGGVQKEFFLLLLRDILNPQFGMFVQDEESNFIWFSDEPLLYGSLNYFKLVGIVCGLAIYNSVIIDLPFPAALYKKLLRKPTDLSDLKQLRPSVGKHLESLLTYEGADFEETFSLTFELTRSSFGEVVTVPLVPGGSSVPVTMDNCTEYVRAYVRHVLDESVKEPFVAFDEGFKRVCDGKVLSMLHPLELMSLVVGQQAINWSELERYMDYKNGYHKEHPVIKLFWSVFNDLPAEAKRKFLVFWTGSNRIPVAGVESMKMMIQRMDGGRNCERLPVAHTCFNVLDLPPYPSHELMKQKLLQAINFTSGFGIV